MSEREGRGHALRLRPLQRLHAAPLAVQLGTEAVCRRARLPFAGHLDGTRVFVDRLLEQARDGSAYPHVVEASDVVMGFACLYRQGPCGSTLEPTFAVAEECWGQGIGTHVCRSLTTAAHALCRAGEGERVLARCLRDNTAALEVLRRCGFEPCETSGSIIVRLMGSPQETEQIVR